MIIQDSEFGEILLRKNPLASGIKFSVSTSGRLQISAPSHTSINTVKRLLEKNRTTIREKLEIKNPATQRARDAKQQILKKQARGYLPYRLDFWAHKFGYRYQRLRLTHANTRWGSCSSLGTISLNIGLMNVPEVLRDYVIIHELAHLNHLDHSAAFWQEVASHDPHYKTHRKRLKLFSPGV